MKRLYQSGSPHSAMLYLFISLLAGWSHLFAAVGTGPETHGTAANPILACIAPNSLGVDQIMSTSVRLGWYGGQASTTYQIQYRVANSGGAYTSVTTDVYDGTGFKAYVLTGLTPNTSYEWQIRTICSAAESSAFVAGSNFRAACTPPNSLGVDQIQATSVRLYWYGGQASTTYEIQYRVANSGGAYTSVITDVYDDTGFKTYALTGLTPGTSYEWQVRTVCSPGITSVFVAGTNFTARCTPPNGLGVDQIQATSVRLFWYGGQANTTYEIQYRVAGSGGAYTTITTASFNDTGFKTYALTGLTAGASYEWQVRTVCSPGVTSVFVAGLNFTTACTPPNGLGVDQIQATSVRLFWYGGQANTTYEIQYRVAGSGGAYTTITTASFNDTGFKTYALTGLTAGASYEWQVRTVCSPGITSVFVAGLNFTTACTPPAGLFVDQIQSTSVRLGWSGGQRSTTYEVQYRVAGSGSAYTSVTSIADNGNGSLYTLTGLTPGVTYEWQVRTVCSPGVTSVFVAGTNFTSICPVVAGLFVDQIQSTSVRLGWSGSQRNTTYELQYRVAGSGSAYTSVTSIADNGNGALYTLTGLTPGVSYEWQVRTVCSPGVTSTFVAGLNFTTICPVAGALGVDQVQSTSVRLYWGGSQRNTTYELQYRVAGSGSAYTSVPGIADNGNGALYTLTGLTPGASYEWQVRTVCSPGVTSAFVAGPNFTPICPVAGALGVDQVQSTSVRLYWGGSQRNTTYELQYRVAGSGTAYTSVPGIADNGNGALYTLTGLVPNTTYEWQVRTVCSPGVASAYVAGTNFTTTTSTNQPPTVVNIIPAQSATVSVGYSYAIPANTFNDPNGDVLTLSATGLPSGLTLSGSTISGTPLVMGTSTVMVTANDGKGGTVSTSFVLTVNPAPVMVTPLSLVASANPTTILTTGTTTLSATVSGGTAPYSYTFSGPGTITPSGNTATVANLSAGSQTFTVLVRDATSPTSQTISATVSVLVNTPPPVNQPPVATANANQTATVGVGFSYMVNAFTDPNGDALTYTASISPANGLTFNPITRIISGTPLVTGVSTMTVTATDPGGLSASTIFTITVNPAPVMVTPLSLVASANPTTILTTGTTTLSATVSGGTAPYSYTFSGPGTITPSGNTATVANLSAGSQTFTVLVRDATSPTSQTISATVSVLVNTPPPVNQPPVATANANQTATVGVGFSYMVNAFTDPNGDALTYTASISPANGLTFNPITRIISGTPSQTGVSAVTVTATDPGSLSASTTFTITVSASATQPTSPATLTITSFTCFSTAGTLSSVNFVVGYPNGSFTPALPALFISGVTASGQLGQTYTFGFDTNASTLPIQDNATRSTYFVWNFRAACAGSVSPPMLTAPVAPALPNQLATQGTFFSYVVPAFSGTAPITYSATGLPAGLSFDAGTRTISGTPTAVQMPTVVISASNTAGQSSGTFTIAVSASAVQPTGPTTLTITSFSCFSTAGALSSVNFVVGYNNGTFAPALPALFMNGVTTSGQLGQAYTLNFDGNAAPLGVQDNASRSTYFVWNYRQACAGPVTPPVPTGPATLTITSFSCFSTAGALSSVNFVVGYNNGTFAPALPALFMNGVTTSGQLGQAYTLNFDGNAAPLGVQDNASRSTYFVWNYRQACAAKFSNSRLSAEPVTPLHISVLGNPVGETVDVEVTGAAGSSLNLLLINVQGRIVGQQAIEQALPVEKARFNVRQQPGGMLLLRATTPTQQQTVRVLKLD